MKPRLEIETQGKCNQVENACVVQTKYGYYLEVSTKDKRPECNCMSGVDGKGAYSGISFFTNDGVQLVKVYGTWDAVLYNVRYGATVILLPKEYFDNGAIVANTRNKE